MSNFVAHKGSYDYMFGLVLSLLTLRVSLGFVCVFIKYVDQNIYVENNVVMSNMAQRWPFLYVISL